MERAIWTMFRTLVTTNRTWINCSFSRMEHLHRVGSKGKGSIEWPPGSPELTLINFFRSVVKNKVYEKNLKTVNELKNYIHDAFGEIDENRNVCRTVGQGCFGQV